MAQKERELISERTKAALAAAKARGKVLGGDRGYRPCSGPDPVLATIQRREAAMRAAHRLNLDIRRISAGAPISDAAMARGLNAQGIPTPSRKGRWTHTTVARLRARTGLIASERLSARRQTPESSVVRLDA